VFDQASAALFKDAFSLSEGRVDRDFLDDAKRFLELIMLRRVKDSVDVGVKIPEKTEITLSVPLSKYQHSWYLRILKGCDQLLGETGSSARQKYLAGVGSPVESTQSSGMPKNTYRVLRNTLMELRKVRLTHQT
jgi:SWI/SNF-related matrix-associated actin-dependent regulator of chromatin subfamily A member 5